MASVSLTKSPNGPAWLAPSNSSLGMIGAWGPVVTPFLLHRGVRPRFAIGSVNTAEVAVASTSAFSLLASIGSGSFKVEVLIPMLLGGVVAAPVAAWMIRHVPARIMGVAVAGLLGTRRAVSSPPLQTIRAVT